MANHLAEKLTLEKAAHGAAKKKLSDECADLIIKLWDHRNSLPNGARPFGAFEPLFSVLQDLANNSQPRNFYLRASPPAVKAPKEILELIALVTRIDDAANTLIRFILARVVERVPAKDKRWTKLRAAIKPSHFDIQIVFRAMGEAEKLVDEKQKLKSAEIKELKGLLADLKVFMGLAQEVRTHFENRVAVVEKR